MSAFFRRSQRFWLMILGLMAALIMLFPIYWMLATAMKTQSDVLAYPPSLFPESPTPASFVLNLLGTSNSPSILWYMRNSFIIGCGNMLMCLLFAVPCAYATAKKKVRGTQYIMLAMFITQMFPAILLATPIYIMYVRLGLMDSYFGLVLANMTASMPFTVIMIRPFFLTIPDELEDAAMIDGAGRFTTYRRIVLPLVKPALITVGAFSFLHGWGDLLYAITLVDNTAMRPVTVKIYNFISEYEAQWNHLMAAAFISTVPIILIFILLQKHIVSGVTAGAIK